MNDLETRLREALVTKIDDAPAARPTARFVPNPREGRAHYRLPRRAETTALLAVMATIVALVLAPGRPEGPVDVGAGPPAPEATAGVPRLPRIVVDLPGVEAVVVDERVIVAGPSGGPGIDGFYVQSFRTPEGLVPPLLWVLSVPPSPSNPNDFDFYGGRQVVVQGTSARIRGTTPILRLAWPADGGGGGVILSSWGLSEDELVAVADGLQPRSSGWHATVLPDGLAPEVDSSRTAGQRTADTRRVSATYRDASGRQLELTISDASPVTFDDRLESVGNAKALEAVTVAGRQGLMVEAGGDGTNWSVVWQPTDWSMAELSVSRATADDIVSRDEVLAILTGVRAVSDEEWQARLPTRPS